MISAAIAEVPDNYENDIYGILKHAYPSASEAEIEQAVGHALLGKGNQWEKATVHFKKAVELNPKLYNSWYSLGIIHCDTEEGYGYFEKAIQIKPDFPEPYYWMAYYRCRNKEDEKVIPLFKKYLEIAKGHAEEADRIKVAKEVLQDLIAGTEGQNLSIMRGAK